ncbi:outer membrane protein [Gellertiella hungarica]|uniref:Outer membrane immunogenic protein n=1 Tax=Gellertiella hungarica TaxID=1572859 RepID=A0A7W6NM11_9HYPH|nr:outer membrane protein [Gellertiella hungarica]MBB4066144.1 outer membrane immunogenic protein [Gellertiella hungarica]
MSVNRQEPHSARIRAVLSAMVAVLAIGGGPAATARAADLEAQAAPYETGPYDWSGAYVGAAASYSWGKDRTTEYVTATGAPRNMFFDYEPKGKSGGIKAGANMQKGSFVFGAEADFELSNLRGTFIDTIENLGRGDDNYDWKASLRGRAGIALDRFMVYGTGGLAAARIRNVYTLVPLRVSEPIEDTRYGWTAGIGVDYALTDNLIAGLEYRYTRFNRYTNVSTVAFPGLSGTQEPSLNDIRITLSYKF